MRSFLKILINVKLVDEKSIMFELIHVNSSIHDWCNTILFINKDFVIEKGNTFKYTPNRLFLPYKLELNKIYICKYDFISEQERRNKLKELYDNLILFSKSNVFINNKRADFLSYTLNLINENWYLY